LCTDISGKKKKRRGADWISGDEPAGLREKRKKKWHSQWDTFHENIFPEIPVHMGCCTVLILPLRYGLRRFCP
jgi:hypothetical protein